MTKEYEIGDADHALDRNQQFGLLRGNGHIEGGPAELDDEASPPTVTAPTPWSVYVDGETVEIDEGGNTVELPQPHPTLDRWDVIYVDPTGALAVESGDPAEVIGDRGLQAREPAPPSFAEIDGVVIAAAYRQFDEADGAAFALSELFFDRRVRTLADVESLSVKNAEIEEGSAGELTVDSEPVDDVDVVRKLEADALQDNINSLNTAFEDHSERHENNGADELNVDGLSGDLADRQDPKDHQERHHEGGPDPIAEGSLTRQDPTNHGERHHDGGPDPLDPENLESPTNESLVLTAGGWDAPEGGTVSDTFTSSGTYEVPNNVDNVMALVVGGGGSGATGNTSDFVDRPGGSGGGGGGFAIDIFNIETLPDTIPITVGAGGEPVQESAEDGVSGGDSSFGDYIVAGGGGGGNSEIDTNIAGEPGEGGNVEREHLLSISNADGGKGGEEGVDAEPGVSTAGTGGGGGGAHTSDGAGGAGGDGRIPNSGGDVGEDAGEFGGGGGADESSSGSGGFPGGGGGGGRAGDLFEAGAGADGLVRIIAW